MKFRSVAFNDRGWRKYLPAAAYSAIHSWKFKGATRLRHWLGLQPRDVERLISSYACAFTRPGSTFLDIGAQHGRHVRALLDGGPATASAVAFEANPALAARFEGNFAEEIASQRVQIVHAAVADEPGITEFFVNTFDSGYSGLVRRDIQETKPDYSLCVVTRTSIDEFCKAFDRPVSCIKIDVEGAEFAVMKGARKTLQESRPVVLFECVNNAAPFYGHTLADIVPWLEELGFAIAGISGQRITGEAARPLFDSRSCCDFIAFPKERAAEVDEQVERNLDAD